MAEKNRPGGPDLAAITGPMLPKAGLVQFWPAKCGPGPILVCKKWTHAVQFRYEKWTQSNLGMKK